MDQKTILFFCNIVNNLAIRHASGWNNFHNQLQALGHFCQHGHFQLVHNSWYIDQSTHYHKYNRVHILNFWIIHNRSYNQIDRPNQNQKGNENGYFVRSSQVRTGFSQNNDSQHAHTVKYPNSKAEKVNETVNVPA